MMDVWVQRDGSGTIVGAFGNLQPGYAEEQISTSDPAVVAFLNPPVTPQTVVPQDLMAQFTADDAAAIQTAIGSNAQFWLLWQAMTAQKDPMVVTNARFLAGWNALVQVLGQARMGAIAAALNITGVE
jgi:hypothetical protein